MKVRLISTSCTCHVCPFGGLERWSHLVGHSRGRLGGQFEAQPFALRCPIVWGYGSADGDVDVPASVQKNFQKLEASARMSVRQRRHATKSFPEKQTLPTSRYIW
jgi:hypothetical protein